MNAWSAEESLLAVLMADNTTFWRVADTVCAQDFAPANRWLFELVAGTIRDGKAADAVTLSDEMSGERLRTMMDIASNAPGRAVNVEAYARQVADVGERRRVREAGERIALAGSYSEAQNLLADVRPQQAARMKSAKDGLREMVEALQRRYDATGEVSGIRTGVESLDALTSGWQPGNLVVLAARPGMGKSAFALQAAMAAGRSLFFSLEMTAGELMERAVANVGQLPHRWLRFPKDAPEYALSQITAASSQVSAMPLQLDDSVGLTVDAICARVKQAHMAEPLDLVIVDHLGLVARDGKHDASELGAITAQLKRLAKETNTTVLLLCQLNRGLEGRPDKRPLLSDLRDSGRIEEDADVVVALYREEYYQSGPLDGYLEIIIRKNRSGEQGTAWAKSVLSQMRLESCDAPEQPAGQAASNGRRGGFAASYGKDSQPCALS